MDERVPMGHAGPEALDRLEPLLAQLRHVGGLTERKRGNFARGSKAFLHFHRHETGLYADVKFGDDWERFRVSTKVERQRFLRRVQPTVGPV